MKTNCKIMAALFAFYRNAVLAPINYRRFWVWSSITCNTTPHI